MVGEAEYSISFKDEQIEVRDYSTICLALTEIRGEVGGMKLVVCGPQQPVAPVLSRRGNHSPLGQNLHITLHGKTRSWLFSFGHCA